MKRAALCSHLYHWNHGRIDVDEISSNLLGMLDDQLEKLNDADDGRWPGQYPDVHLLMSQPGSGCSNRTLAFVLTVGDVRRFPRGKQVASYLGLIPREYSSGGKQRMGGISKQGNRLLRFLLVEAANIAVRFDPVFRKEYLHRCHQKHFTVAKVAAASYACDTDVLLDPSHANTVSESSSHREWPEMYSGQRKPDRQAE